LRSGEHDDCVADGADDPQLRPSDEQESRVGGGIFGVLVATSAWDVRLGILRPRQSPVAPRGAEITILRTGDPLG